MAITTFSGLKASVAGWLARSDLDSDLGSFVELATAMFNRRLRTRQMIATATLTPVDGVAIIPSDYLQYRRVTETGGVRRALSYLSPDAAEREYPFNYSGQSAHFSIIGGSLVTYPQSANPVELVYFQKIPALSDAVTTNWVLEQYPELYLRAATAYGADFIKDDAQMQKFMSMAERLIFEIGSVDNLANYADAETWTKGIHP